MWPWIKRWRDWAMRDLWPIYRIGPQPQALFYSYEKAGLVLHDNLVAPAPNLELVARAQLGGSLGSPRVGELGDGRLTALLDEQPRVHR